MEVVLPCTDLDAAMRYFVDELAFVLRVISPADQPRRALLEGHGMRLSLEVGAPVAPGLLRLRSPNGARHTETAPNGTRIEFVDSSAPLALSTVAQQFVCTRPSGADGGPEGQHVGRAGMVYRDLLPCRLGGRFIASHIRIANGGEVPDYPHHHHVQFQMIYCHRGWVKLVYEDQGAPFVLRAGDAVLQPPGILHRVLECSVGLEVVEIGSPAEHDTFAEAERVLPTAVERPERTFGGQRFVRHVAATSSWQPCIEPDCEARDTGVGAATAGLASAQVLRARDVDRVALAPHDGDLLFVFVTQGAATLVAGGRRERCFEGCAAAIPAAEVAHWQEPRALQWLEVRLPGYSS